MKLQRRYASLAMVMFLVSALSFATDRDDADEPIAPPPIPQKNSAPPKKKVKAKARKVAAAEEENPYEDTRATASEDARAEDIAFVFGLTAGYSGLTGSETGTTTTASAPALTHQNFGLGATADFQAAKYFGVEAEGYLGLNASNTNALSATYIQRSLSGFSGDVKAQIPIEAGNGRISPKLGLGYAYNQITENTLSTDLTTVTASSITKMTGSYVVGGVDWVPAQDWLLSADYAHSLTVDGSTSSANVGVAATQTESVVSGSFDRLRAGAFYRVAPHFVVGAQYVRRFFNYSMTNSITTSTLITPTVTDQRIYYLNQGLALFMYEL